MKYTVRYDTSYYPNGSKTKLYVGTIRQLSNATDTLRIEFASLPSGFTPYLNVARYARDKSYIDSTPTLIGFDYVDGGYEKTLIQWFSEIAGFIDVSVTLLGAEVEIDGEITQERIECGAFYLNIDGVVISQGDSLPPPPPPTEIEFKVDKDLYTYDQVSEIVDNANTYLDNDGTPEKIPVENNGINTDLSLMTKGYINQELAKKVDKQMPTLTMKGNDTGATANAKDLTISEILALLASGGTMQVPGNIQVNGNIYQNGTLYTTDVEYVRSTDNFIELRYGAVAGLNSGEYTGFKFALYDGTNNGYLVVDKDGYAKVGDVGDLQTLATRQDSPVANAVAYWNDTLKRFDTSSKFTFNGSVGSINELTVTNDAIGDVPLIVNAMAGTTNSLQQWKLDNSVKAELTTGGSFYLAGIYNLSNGANASVTVGTNGTVISRNIADTNPALKVNLANAGATGYIADFQFTSSTRGYLKTSGFWGGVGIENYNDLNRGQFAVGSSSLGGQYFRNINDANPALTINNQQGTGNILNLQFGGVNKAVFTKDGYLGIGTTNPSVPLEVSGAGNQYIKVTSTDHLISGIILQRSANNDVYTDYVLKSSNGDLSIDEVTGTTKTRFVLKGDTGKVGIGVVAPSATLEIVNTAIADVPLVINAITGQTGKLQSWQVNSVEKAYIDKDGKAYFTSLSTGINTLFGTLNGPDLTTGNYNTLIGYTAGYKLTEGTDNVAIGKSALQDSLTTDYAIAIGTRALERLLTGDNTIGIGRYAGRYYGSGTDDLSSTTNSIYIGNEARAKENSVTNEIVIGYNAIGNGSNTATIGNSSLTKLYAGSYEVERNIIITSGATLTVSTWSADTTYSGYGYRATITVSGVTANDKAEITFGNTEALSGNYARVTNTNTDTIYIYSMVNTTITLQEIKVIKR